jgi:hypothetical protein
MPVKWEIRDPVLIVRTEGHYQVDELVRSVAEAIADSAFRPGLFILWDGRHSQANITTPDIDWRINWVASLPKMGFSSRCAVVLNREIHRFGLARMLSTKLEAMGVELGIFHGVDEALQWLRGEMPADRV